MKRAFTFFCFATVALICVGCESYTSAPRVQSSTPDPKLLQNVPTMAGDLQAKLLSPTSSLYDPAKAADYKQRLNILMGNKAVKEKLAGGYVQLLQMIQGRPGNTTRALSRNLRRAVTGPEPLTPHLDSVILPPDPGGCTPHPPTAAVGDACPAVEAWFCAAAVAQASAWAYTYAFAEACGVCTSGEAICVRAEAYAYAEAVAYAYSYACTYVSVGGSSSPSATPTPSSSCEGATPIADSVRDFIRSTTEAN